MPLVRFAGHLFDDVDRDINCPALENLLQPRLGILQIVLAWQVSQTALEQDIYGFPYRLDTAIQVDCSQHGFESVRDDRSAAIPTALQLPGAKLEPLTQSDLIADLCERFTSNQMCPQSAQVALVSLWQSQVQPLRDEHPEDRVAEKLEPFIVVASRATMSESLLEMSGNAELVGEVFL